MEIEGWLSANTFNQMLLYMLVYKSEERNSKFTITLVIFLIYFLVVKDNALNFIRASKNLHDDL
jgi:hypothetical protein